MLYNESRRLGRNTAFGFLALALVVLLQMLFGGWGLHRMHNEASVLLISLSDMQLESLELKSALGELRKREKDILLASESSPPEFNAAEARWQEALLAANDQLGKLSDEIEEGTGHVGISIDKLRASLDAYARGVDTVIGLVRSRGTMPPQEANQTLSPYKSIIYEMENELNRVVEDAEEIEQETLGRLVRFRDFLFLLLGGISLLSLLFGGVLSANVTRSSLNISRSLEHQALHDTLTGLLNRRGLASSLSHNTTVGGVLAYLDLDRFKLINDLCGHTAGDDLLVELTDKLAKCCTRHGAVIARVGGDEFAIWLPGAEDLVPAHRLAEQLVHLIEQHHFEWLGQPMTLGASVGLAQAHAGFIYRELVSRADAACRLAKTPGNAKVLVYEETDPQLVQARNEERWAARLPQLIQEGRFLLYGQRIVPLHEGCGKGHIEVLLRGVDEHGLPIPPNTFLAAAERFGLMPRLDRWIIETLLDSKLDEDCEYAVNLSGQTLMDKDYLPRLETLLRESGKAHLLSFEITESAAMTSIDTAREYIHRLKALGCRFALDDFGSGFSSFAYLRDLQVDFLKIDGSLIRIIGRHEADSALVRAIVQMAQTMGLKTIAEYVETPAIAEQLRGLGVDYGQGYGLHKPEPLSAIRRIVA